MRPVRLTITVVGSVLVVAIATVAALVVIYGHRLQTIRAEQASKVRLAELELRTKEIDRLWSFQNDKMRDRMTGQYIDKYWSNQ